VLSNAGFTLGGYVQIGTGAVAEIRHLVAFGSLVFDAPMLRAHAAGETVRAVAPPGGDRTGPVIVVRALDDDARFRVGQTVVLRLQCTDRGVGVEVCGDRVSDGARLDTSSPGVRSITIRAWDRNGNVSVRTFSYRVVAVRPGTSGECSDDEGKNERSGFTSSGRRSPRCD
jgi:hypothetical protein